MTSQLYRGHRVNVEADERCGSGALRIEIFEAHTGILRHMDYASLPVNCSSGDGDDAGFQWAREWIAQNPLSWPFARS